MRERDVKSVVGERVGILVEFTRRRTSQGERDFVPLLQLSGDDHRLCLDRQHREQ